MHIDKWKLIQSGGDGGDTCHRMYTMFLRLRIGWWIGLWENAPASTNGTASPQETQALLEVVPGIYHRHPDPDFWGSDPLNCSRDQLTPVICYHALMSHQSPTLGAKSREHLKNLLVRCLKRFMFAQNIYPNWVDARKDPTVKRKTADFINFDLWGVFARGFLGTRWEPLAWPIIIFGDIFLLLSVMFSLWAPINKDGTFSFRMKGPDDVDDDNINNVIMVCQYTKGTPISWLARKLYKWFRRENLGNTQLGEKNHIMGALMWYHRGPDGNPELAEIARQLVQRY